MSVGRFGPVRSVRLVAVLAVLTLTLLVGAQAATAAVPFDQKGKRGGHVLADTSGNPAGVCTYGLVVGNSLDVVEARSPKVFARNRTPGKKDSQWIGVRFQFQHSRNDGGTGGWVNGKKTPVFKRWASDTTSVGVGKRGWQAEYSGSPHFRVVAQIIWYKPGTQSVVQGSLKLRYSWYTTQLGPTVDTAMARCLPEP